MYKIWQGSNSFTKQFERNPNIRSNLWISLLPRNQTNTKRTRKIFLQLGRICLRILSRQSENLSVFCKVFSQIAFRDMMVSFYRYQVVEKSFESVLCLFGFVKAAKFRDSSEYSDCIQNVWAKSCLPYQILYIRQKKFLQRAEKPRYEFSDTVLCSTCK